MATATGMLRGIGGAMAGEQARLGRRDNLLTIAFGIWLLAGIFIDGWAHNSRTLVESFFTPWHAVLYSGYAASSLWLCWLVLRQQRAGFAGRAAIPRGYELGLVGALIFGLGGLGDLLWHVAFGIETNLKALLSPTHLLLFAGIFLILTSPFRAAWSSREVADAPTFAAFLPALLSLTFAVSAASFMSMYFWALLDGFHFTGAIRFYSTQAGGGRLLSWSQELGIDGILLTNVLLIAPLLLALRRWRLPFGSVTLLFTLNTALMNVLDEFGPRETLPVALVAGIAADALIAALRPGVARPWAMRLFAALVPLIFWSLYFLAGELRFGVGWPPELWSGAIVLCAFSGVGLSLLAVPPAVPEAIEARE